MENAIDPKRNNSTKSSFQDAEKAFDKCHVRRYCIDRKFNGHFMLKICKLLALVVGEIVKNSRGF